jgi:hypothetical protein
MLPLGGLHVKHAVQRGIWVPTQHFALGTTVTLIELAGRRSSGCKLTSSQQFGFKYANPDINLYLCCCFILGKNFYMFAFSEFLCAYVMDKHRTLYNTCEQSECLYAHLRMQTYIYLYLWLFEYRCIWIPRVFCGLDKSDALWGLLLIK